MRASGPYEVRPRQLRALVLLLALLPLLPMTFVVRFVIEAVVNERLEARERVRPAYQRFLEDTSQRLSANVARSLLLEPPPDVSDPWRIIRERPGAVDTALLVSSEGQLSPPEMVDAGAQGSAVQAAAALAHATVERGVRYAALAPSGPVRWRFLAETPEPIYSLHPAGALARREDTPPSLLLTKTRHHLLEQIAGYYQKELDPQTALRLVDETGESQGLLGPADAPSTGEPLGETPLRPPLPAWRLQLFSTDTSLVTGLAREQVSFYWWSVVGMVAVTAGIAAAAGWALTRRISLHELSNDALAVVSHEMKTPLASIRLLIETLLSRRYQGGAEAVDEYLRLMDAENTRLIRLVEDFQTLSRLENARGGQSRLKLEPVRPEEIIDAAATRLAGRLEAEGCDFQTAGDLRAPAFPGDREALTAVLVNLLDNALKYTGEEKRIALRVRDAVDRVRFEVSDDGVGIAPEEQGRIFERFYQSDHRLARTHEGCGLGLNIVRSAVKAHGGSVSVQSTPGRGSTFTVSVPRKQPTAG